MCGMSQEKTIKTTTDIDSLRSEIRDKSVRVIDVEEKKITNKVISQLQ